MSSRKIMGYRVVLYGPNGNKIETWDGHFNVKDGTTGPVRMRNGNGLLGGICRAVREHKFNTGEVQ